ncbi:hypothetical protein QT327_21225 [Olivibacter sp. 47]|uniref:phage tail protein n=1 Tax=Olivibacter sp. 47 TaxID=3056486 RepID=UPI0025A4A772|nr:phage tail protein [Olivibacter sp. 47]MDM8176838.1 hypothetical protein [Olivibacter sp. 47]
MKLSVHRKSVNVAELNVTVQAVFTKVLMGEHKIVFSNLEVPTKLDIQIGDTIEHRGEVFTINTPVGYQKVSNIKHVYNITFEGIRYKLYDKKFLYEGASDFQFFGNARQFVQLVVDNINEINSGWSVGVVDETAEIHMDFDNDSCRTALTKIAEQFKLEWDLTNKTIHLVKQAGNTTDLVFEYGRGKGLYSLSQEYVQDKNIITRAYGTGGTRNLPKGYKGKRISLPEKFLEDAVSIDKYGVKEGEYRNEEIYPKRDGVITAASEVSDEKTIFSITDTSLDFDINACLLAGVSAKVGFQTGELSGYTFEIAKYDHDTKTIFCKPDVSNSDYVMPNTTFKAQVGDVYRLFDIDMPQSYMTAAIEELREGTMVYLNESKVPQVLYGLDLDIMYLRDKGIWLNAGDKVRVKDTSLKLDELIRVTGVSYPITFPDILTTDTKVTATIANFVPYTIEERIVKDTIDNKKVIKVVDRTNAERARRNAYDLRQLQANILDPDNYFNPERIKPLSIETYMLSVGAKSQNFGLNGVDINANYGGDPNHMTVSLGSLIHYEAEISGLGYVWQVQAGDFPNLDPVKSYYLSAKCNQHALTGQWYLSDELMRTEQEAGYWHFNVGILYPVKDGYRGFDFTKGMTFIVGDTITTGVIKSLDGLNFFDLTQGKFSLGDDVSGIDWDVTNAGALTIRGAVASSTVLVGSGGFVSAGLSGLADNGDQSIRFWSGADLLNKDTAPFRVLNNGYVYATNLTLGYGSSASGNSNGWRVSPSGIISDYSGDVSNFALIRGSDLKSSFAFATDLIPSSSGGSFSLTGRLTNKKLSPSEFPIIKNRNTALELEASGADTNVALDIKSGTLNLNGNNIVVTDGKEGKSFTLDFRVGGESWYQLEFINGVVVGITNVTNT